MLYKQVPIDALVYRGDSRKPSQIFRTGFETQKEPAYVWEKLIKGESSHERIDTSTVGDEGSGSDSEDDEISTNITEMDLQLYGPLVVPPYRHGQKVYRVTLSKPTPTPKYLDIKVKVGGSLSKDDPKTALGILATEFLTNKAKYREDMQDVSPQSAVCVTLRPEIAPYFPLEGAPNGEWTWIYVARLTVGVKTYEIQSKNKSANVYALELATQHIPFTHVIAAIRCRRKGKHPVMEFYFSPRIRWNPYANGYERKRSAYEIEKAVYDFMGYDWKCPNSHSRDATRLQRTIRGEPLNPE